MKDVESLLECGKIEEAFSEAYPYTLRIANRFHIKHMEKADVDNEALFVLWISLKTYQPSVGVKFITYLGNCVTNRLMKLIKSSYVKKRDDSAIDNAVLKMFFPLSFSSNFDIKLDLEYFIPKSMPYKLAAFWKEFLNCGSFVDAGQNLGYTKNEARHLRNKAIEKVKVIWKIKK